MAGLHDELHGLLEGLVLDRLRPEVAAAVGAVGQVQGVAGGTLVHPAHDDQDPQAHAGLFEVVLELALPPGDLPL